MIGNRYNTWLFQMFVLIMASACANEAPTVSFECANDHFRRDSWKSIAQFNLLIRPLAVLTPLLSKSL